MISLAETRRRFSYLTSIAMVGLALAGCGLPNGNLAIDELARQCDQGAAIATHVAKVHPGDVVHLSNQISIAPEGILYIAETNIVVPKNGLVIGKNTPITVSVVPGGVQFQQRCPTSGTD